METGAPDQERQRRRLHHIGRDLMDAHQRFQTLALELLHQQGHTNLTPALVGLLPHLSLDGTPLAELAARSATTRQAVGQLVNELARLGLVSKHTDAADRRAIIVRFTPAGRRLIVDAAKVKDEIEARYAAVLGNEGLQELRDFLRKLNAAPC